MVATTRYFQITVTNCLSPNILKSIILTARMQGSPLLSTKLQKKLFDDSKYV